jgi:hypothetical protein
MTELQLTATAGRTVASPEACDDQGLGGIVKRPEGPG